MKRLILAGLIGVASIVTTACAPKVDTIDYNQRSLKLSLGMSKSDVMQVMGQPRRTDVNQERERWIYWNKALYGYTIVDNEQLATDRLTVTFVDGKVTKWGQQTLTDDILESTQKTAQAYADAAKETKK
ncbi:outer membrane protein assembly factor BamE domain-containing protein [Citrobacter koseri]|uniref:outer membrane protein assembly factor BamE domain-containing protein n=1 Tax=Citrobacter koseri TaxID=545 RepID=UPI0020032925|nr:outer membrane protein assembly factor BamE [Citrobacter koseri]MCK7562529.1 outer membrane protein assembly factor BamE [Citrobacter koseri]